ncbi:MAG TPA: ABC transporter ATP-binding protein, partial [Candidatus Acetothermia bacterium]|nr:ABC transporter ATP-binding protein [Candidatus Acetothermia bacterium]
EPLSALDAKLRESLRREIRRIQQEVKLATLHVTHDQDEAMAISDRMAVMHAGRIEQIGTPSEIYSHPESAFVASFIGHANVIAGTITSVSEERLEMDASGTMLRAAASGRDFHPGEDVLLFCKEEKLRLADDGQKTVSARVIIAEYHGETVIVHLESRIGPLRLRMPAGMASNMSAGMQVSVCLPPEECDVFPQKTLS